jgi:hypothetical protein
VFVASARPFSPRASFLTPCATHPPTHPPTPPARPPAAQSLGLLRRQRIPLAHVEALARDVREAGVAFAEGERVKVYHMECLAWEVRAAEAVAAGRRAPRDELLALLADADALPVDLSRRTAALRLELVRARRWVERVRALVPRGASRSTRKAGEGKPATLAELSAMVAQVTAGRVAASGDDMDEAAAVVESAAQWIADVRAALDRGGGGGEGAAAAGAAGGDGGDGGDDVTLESLSALLRSADDIPVAMECVFA